jgi:phage-related minor tail protein
MAKLGSISVDLGIDTSDLKSGLKEVEKATKETSDSVKKTGDQIQDSFKKATDTIDQSFVEMLSSSKKVWVQMSDGSKAFIDAHGKLRSETGQMKTDIDGLGKAFKEALAGNVDSANKLKSAITGVEEKIEDTEKQTDKTNRKLTDGFKNVGSVISSTVTPAILAIGAAAVAIASEFDGANAKIQNSLGVTADEAGELADSVKNVYRKGIGESQAVVTDALIKTRQNMRKLADDELELVTKKAIILGETFDSDVNEVTRAGNNLMEAFGISSDKAFDLMASGAQRGLNFSSEMFDNLAEYSNLFDDMGFTAEEYFQLLEKGSSAGVYNLD